MANELPAAVVFDNDLREQAAQNTLAANPLVGVRLEDILDSARLLVGQMLSSPGVAAQEYLRFLGELGRIVTGGSELTPDAKDKRFADSAWKDSAIYRALACVRPCTREKHRPVRVERRFADLRHQLEEPHCP